jgi:hypothetical protein
VAILVDAPPARAIGCEHERERHGIRMVVVTANGMVDRVAAES